MLVGGRPAPAEYKSILTKIQPPLMTLESLHKVNGKVNMFMLVLFPVCLLALEKKVDRYHMYSHMLKSNKTANNRLESSKECKRECA